MDYSSFLNYSLSNNVKNKNCYRINNRKPAKKRASLRFFLLFAVLSFSILFTFSSYSTRNPQTSAITSISSDNKLKNIQTTILELPVLTHHTEPVVEPSPFEEIETETAEEIKPVAITKDIEHPNLIKISTITNSKEPVSKKPQAKEPLIEKTNVNNIVVVINNKSSGEKQSVVITSSETKTKIASNSKTIVVKKGDSLSTIFKRLSLSANTLYKIINSDQQAKKLKKIKPGQKMTFYLTDNKFTSLHYEMNKVDTLIIDKKDKQFISHIESKDIETRQKFTSAAIENSLFLAGNKAGLSSAMIMEMAGIFGWDIDFALDVRKGDSFTVLYEEKFINDKKFSNGHILSAEFINKGKSYTAVRFTDSSGHTDYYSEKGLSMRKAFLRTPVEFSRISSRFSYSRKHPVLNKRRAHKGVDYAASRGTPIKAVGKGKVIFKGTKGGYGRVIILQHGSKYSTLYAHMNSYNKNVRKGSLVKQGQTIGYVGSSGLATGPHLHYEFRVNGVHRNPLTVSLPTAAPIEKKYRNDFQSTADTLISQLKSRKQETIALKD